jgi:hypothetical protein
MENFSKLCHSWADRINPIGVFPVASLLELKSLDSGKTALHCCDCFTNGQFIDGAGFMGPDVLLTTKRWAILWIFIRNCWFKEF